MLFEFTKSNGVQVASILLRRKEVCEVAKEIARYQASGPVPEVDHEPVDEKQFQGDNFVIKTCDYV